MAKKKAANPWPLRLKDLRKRHELTQAAAAKRIGVTTRTWVSWENNQRNPSKTAQHLLRLLFWEKK